MDITKDTLVRYLNCETTMAEEDAIAKWLDEDESHRKELDELDFVFGSAVMGWKTRIKRRSFFSTAWGRALVFAASALVVLGSSLWAGKAYSDHKFEQRASKMMSMSVPAGQRVNVTLPDGTKVTMNSCSRIDYPAVFGDGCRNVTVEGEVLFDVAHDAEHPFIVDAFGCTVQALGTKFLVNSNKAESTFSTELLEGSIRVSDKAAGVQAILKPGEKASLVDGRLICEEVSGQDGYLWTDGIISLDGKSFEELMKSYEKAYGFNIIYRSDCIPQIRCKGKIRVADGIEHSLSVLKKGGTKFNYEIDYNLKEVYIW